jgi:hypothetical protein
MLTNKIYVILGSLYLTRKEIEMKKYQVCASATVYYYKIVEANNIDEATEQAWEGTDLDTWKERDIGGWQIDSAIEIV